MALQSHINFGLTQVAFKLPNFHTGSMQWACHLHAKNSNKEVRHASNKLQKPCNNLPLLLCVTIAVSPF